jgi:hypothetical protein
MSEKGTMRDVTLSTEGNTKRGKHLCLNPRNLISTRYIDICLAHIKY